MSRLLCVMMLSGCVPSIADDAGLRLMTLNIANGAGDRFRTQEVRLRQAALVTAVEATALQEVDVGVERSARRNTALDVAGPEFTGCSFTVAAAPHLSPEGLLQCSAEVGTVLFGVAFQGDDLYATDSAGLPAGIMDTDPSLNPVSIDRSATAFFGNALLVRGRRVASAAVVALPIEPSPQPLGKYEALASGPEQIRAAHNLSIRSTMGIEPRSVLVVRFDQPAMALLVTHFEGGADLVALRTLQLEATAAIARGEQQQGRRVVLLADFNMPPSDSAAALGEAGVLHAAGDQVDQIWADEALRVSEPVSQPTEGASDHLFAPSVTVR